MAMEALRIAAKESKFMKFILGGFIFLAVGGLVFTDINGYFRGGLPNTTIARVGDTEIDVREFDQGLRGFLAQTGMTTEQAYDAGLINAYLQSRIDNILALQDANDLDIVVGDALIAKQIKEIFPNASKDEIQSRLRAQGMSEERMAYILSQEIKTEIVGRAPEIIKEYPSSSLTDAIQRYNGEQRSGTIYRFPASQLTDAITITDTDIENYYNAAKASQYAIPETRVFTIATLTVNDAKKNIPPVTEDELRGEYNAHMNDFIVPEKRSLAQAVVNDPDQAQAIYEKTSKGMSLSDALKEVTGGTSGFRDVAAYEESGLPDELAEPVFKDSVKSGDILPPIRTLLGLHVIKITKIEPETTKSFDSVKSDMRKEIETSRTYDALYEKMMETESLLDTGSNFNDILDKITMKTKDTKPLSKNTTDSYPETLQEILDVSSSVLDEIFNLPAGGASYPIETGDDRYVVIGVKSINEAGFTPLADVQKQIVTQLKSSRVNALATQQIDDIIAKLNDQSLSPNDLVKQYDAKKDDFKLITRGNDQFNTATIFNTVHGSYGGNVVDANVVIAHVKDVQFDKKTEADAFDLSILTDSLLQTFRRDSVEITINDDLLKTQYRPDNS